MSLADSSINCLPGQLPKSKILGIVDDKVYDANDNNVALPKNEFAQYILDEIGQFGKFDYSEFKSIFDVVQDILNAWQSAR